jgi:hypothetical protein
MPDQQRAIGDTFIDPANGEVLTVVRAVEMDMCDGCYYSHGIECRADRAVSEASGGCWAEGEWETKFVPAKEALI